MALRRTLQFNTGWRFRLTDLGMAGDPFERSYSDSGWDDVTLPHTPRLEPVDVRMPWQGICWYRREFVANPSWKGRRVTVVFGAAMQQAEVWVNSVHKLSHQGGYLPFSVDITELLDYDRPNLIAVRLDNRDTDQFPPGKPTDDLDFFYSGGLYRGATLVITDPLHVTDSIEADVVAGGGVFVTYENVSKDRATVRIKTHVANSGFDLARNCIVGSQIVDENGGVAGSHCSQPVMIASGGSHTFLQTIEIENPRLWDTDHPNLYTLETTVERAGVAVDSMSTRIGIRTIEFGKRFILNGKDLPIRGTNRHQEYPYIGYALSPNAHRRDAVKIKEAGLNFVRLSHYPQDPAFLDACDELGILVQAPIPGWQIFRANSSFVDASFRDIRQLIRRDRNHPSVIVWEPNFNETDGDHTDWCRGAYEIAHAEHPGPQCFTFGDDYPAGWTGWDVKGLVREYGDWCFGGNESTSRQRRGAGEDAMLQQAWNFQWTLNYLNRQFDDPDATYVGAANWVMFDHNRGYYPKPNWCGMMDIFRLPKFVYYFYQSQRDPSTKSPNFDSGPMVFIASFWTERTASSKVIVYSNGDEVELFLNGRSIGRRKPDSGTDSPYSDKLVSLATLGHDVDKSGGRPFDGGNSLHVPHAPFTFVDVAYEPGELKAIAYLDGRESAEHIVRTPGEPKALRLSVDLADTNLSADGVDAVFVHAHVVDANGTVVPNASPRVTFKVDGPARIIGGEPAVVEGGIASALLQAGLEPGRITVTATSPELTPSTIAIESLSAAPTDRHG
jgi:beta-galactosidase